MVMYSSVKEGIAPEHVERVVRGGDGSTLKSTRVGTDTLCNEANYVCALRSIVYTLESLETHDSSTCASPPWKAIILSSITSPSDHRTLLPREAQCGKPYTTVMYKPRAGTWSVVIVRRQQEDLRQGLKSWKKLMEVLPTAVIEMPMALPAWHDILPMVYAFPGTKVVRPYSSEIFGAVLYVVAFVAAESSNANLTAAGEPLREYEEVSSMLSSGMRRWILHILPASEAGMSKLKIEEMLPEAVPLKEVP